MTDPCLNQDNLIEPESLVQDDLVNDESALTLDNMETIPCSE